MKILIILAALSMTTLSAKECVLDEVNSILSTLAKEVDAACGWTIQKVVEENILKACQEADKKHGVQFSSSGPKALRFTQFTQTFNVNEPFFYCKNKRGYESYFAQSVLSLTKESDANKRAEYEKEKRAKNERTPLAEIDLAKVKNWRCVRPNYIPIPQIYSAGQKEAMDIAYSDDPRYACVPWN